MDTLKKLREYAAKAGGGVVKTHFGVVYAFDDAKAFPIRPDETLQALESGGEFWDSIVISQEEIIDLSGENSDLLPKLKDRFWKTKAPEAYDLGAKIGWDYSSLGDGSAVDKCADRAIEAGLLAKTDRQDYIDGFIDGYLFEKYDIPPMYPARHVGTILTFLNL